MIINLRGTSGSGKSTLVKAVMDLCPSCVVVARKDGGKRPAGYVCQLPSGQSLAILGHYEIACGGCDTISDMTEVFKQVRDASDAGHHVLFEGAIVSTLSTQLLQMHKDGYPLEVVSLNTPLPLCLESINKRRRNKWYDQVRAALDYNSNYPNRRPKPTPPEPDPVDPKTTTSKFRSVQATHMKFTQAGIPAIWASREEALTHIRWRLGL